MSRLPLTVAVGITAVVAGSVGLANGVSASTGATTSAGILVGASGGAAGHAVPRSVFVPPSGRFVPNAASVPSWNGSFTFSGKTYHFTMVGTAPSTNVTTTVPVSITPLKIVLANGANTYPTGAITSTKSSALFKSAVFSSGTTQYGDAFQRAEYWNLPLAPNYHVKLGTPTIKPQVTLHVPAADGSLETASDGVKYLAVNINWFTAQTNALAARFPVSSLPIFMSYQTELYTSSPSNAGIGGFHSAVSNSSGTHTYSYASWVTSDIFGASGADIVALSHEIGEWYNDPFVNNTVPNWSVPSEPQYGCNNKLEVGDPLVGRAVTYKGLHYQDLAEVSWFAHLSPSIGQSGNYSFFGTFTSPAKTC